MANNDPLIEIPVTRVHQNVGDFYVGVMNAMDLYHIAEADRIRLRDLKIPKYAGYQRALLEDRVENIRLFLSTPESTFPNAIILSIDSDSIVNWEDVKGDYGTSILKIKREGKVAKIIDGQHRAAALDVAEEGFQVIVSLFVDLEMARCARIFAKINSTQKAVNPSIAFQLFGYSEERSPQRTAHEIAEKLNTTEGSPFYKRLLMLGTKDEWSKGTLSQSSFCKELMRLFSKDPVKDEYRLLNKQKLESYSGYPLRDFFRKGDDSKILEVVWKYFFNIATTWKSQWEQKESILPKTTGYSAFMQVLRSWLKSERSNEVLQDTGVKEAFHKIRQKYETDQHRFVRKNYPAGNQGVIMLRNELLKDLELESE
jgi:DGQHR domain-containing protein